jgi:hypothetical protein
MPERSEGEAAELPVNPAGRATFPGSRADARSYSRFSDTISRRPR